MNNAQLIKTSTVGMKRPQWLEFRQPLSHVKEFLDNRLRVAVNPLIDRTAFWTFEYSDTIFPMLKEFFQSQAWKDFSFPCLGASEVASVMGLNPYKSIIELYYEKIGVKQIYDNDNAAMFWGRELEEQIANKWQYWDGTVETMIDNFANKNILRRCRRLNAYVQNKAYPWLFVSLDRVINKSKSGEEEVEEGSLECKTISGWSSDMWEGGIPVMYVAQLQAQLIACGFKYGEIAILKDGRHFEVYPFDAHPEIGSKILHMTEMFYKLVKAGIECFLLHTYAPTDDLKQEYYGKLDQLAPEPDGSDAYKNYLSEKYNKAEVGEVRGTIVEEQHAMNYKFYSDKIKDLETFKTESSNKLKAFMKETTRLDLGDVGSCTWNENKHGTRTFNVRAKVPANYVPNTFQEAPVKSIETKVLEHNQEEQEFKGDGKKSRGKKKSHFVEGE